MREAPGDVSLQLDYCDIPVGVIGGVLAEQLMSPTRTFCLFLFPPTRTGPFATTRRGLSPFYLKFFQIDYQGDSTFDFHAVAASVVPVPSIDA